MSVYLDIRALFKLHCYITKKKQINANPELHVNRPMFPTNSISLKTSLGTTTTTTSTAMMLWWGDGGLFAHNLTTLNNSVETVARCVCRGWGSGVGGCGSGCVWRCFGDVDDIYHHHNCCCAAYDWDWGMKGAVLRAHEMCVKTFWHARRLCWRMATCKSVTCLTCVSTAATTLLCRR